MYKKQTQFVCKNLFGENKNVEHKKIGYLTSECDLLRNISKITAVRDR